MGSGGTEGSRSGLVTEELEELIRETDSACVGEPLEWRPECFSGISQPP